MESNQGRQPVLISDLHAHTRVHTHIQKKNQTTENQAWGMEAHCSEIEL